MNSQSIIPRKKIFAIVGILSIVASVFMFRSLPPKSKGVDHYISYQVDHPFPIDSTNLLTPKSDAEEKLKSKLSGYDIREALDHVFVEEGLGFVTDTTIIVGDVSIPVVVFDPKTKIGYSWINYDRFGEGLLDEKLSKNKTIEDTKLDFLKSLDECIELFFEDEEYFLGELFPNEEDVAEKEEEVERWTLDEQDWKGVMAAFDKGDITLEEVRKRFEIRNHEYITQAPSPLSRLDFFRNRLNENSEVTLAFSEEVRSQLEALKSYSDKREYLEIILMDFRKQLEVEHLSSIESKTMLDEWKLSAAEMIEEPDRFFAFIKLVDLMRIFSSSSALNKELDNQIFQITQERNKKKWWAHSNAVLDLFNANRSPSVTNKLSYQLLLVDIMSNSKYSKWKKSYQIIEELEDLVNISKDELKALNKLAFEDKIFIAPISVLDNRLIYDMQEEAYLNELQELRTEVSNTKNKKERIELQEKLLELSSNRAANYNDIRKVAKQKSMDILRQDFRKFILWAKEVAREKTA